MRCIAVIDAERPGLDSVIVWDREGQLVAVAYLDGKVTMTRPLGADTLERAITELQDNFQITAGQITRVTDWTSFQTQPVATTRTRW